MNKVLQMDSNCIILIIANLRCIKCDRHPTCLSVMFSFSFYEFKVMGSHTTSVPSPKFPLRFKFFSP